MTRKIATKEKTAVWGVPLKETKEKESRLARIRAQEIIDREMAEAWLRYKKIREARVRKENLERLKEGEYFV